MSRDLSAKTIRDFGEQFTAYPNNDGYYGSTDLLADILGPLLSLEELKGAKVAEIGSGAGRIVKILLDAGVAHVTAVEPSDAFTVLCENVGSSNNVRCLRLTGDKLPPDGTLDYVLSIGVMPFIPEPEPIVEAARTALRPGGRFIIWLYGKEGNGLYLALLQPLRVLTTRLPHIALAALVRVLDLFLVSYCEACRNCPLPLRSYMTGVIAKLTGDKRRFVIYDQLNPTYVKYYTRAEAEALLHGRFQDIRLYHRRGYSWTVIGTKPAD